MNTFAKNKESWIVVAEEKENPMTSTEDWHEIDGYEEERVAREFDYCARCKGLIIPGMKISRRKYRFGTGKSISGSYKGAITWRKFHDEPSCDQPWWHVETTGIATPLGKLRTSAKFLAPRISEKTHRPVPDTPSASRAVVVNNHELGVLTYVPSDKVQHILSKNGPVLGHDALASLEHILEMVLKEVLDAIGSKQRSQLLNYRIEAFMEVGRE